MNALRFSFALLLALASTGALSHGSVTPEGDLCILRIGFYTAHFKVFQPQTSEDTEYCEDLPKAGESVFVMEYLHQGLGQVPIEFRIIRNTTGLGRFAALQDVRALGDLEPLTVFYKRPVVEPGTYSALHAFPAAGEFLGIVSVRNPETGESYEAVFPFSVGFQGIGIWPLFALLAAIAQIGYWLSTGGLQRWQAKRSAKRSLNEVLMSLPLLALLLGADTPEPSLWYSKSGNLQASYTSSPSAVPLNTIHSWNLHLETINGEPLDHADLALTGGMPAHNHGLATEPVVSDSLGDGNYRVDGLRFHMQGDWELRLSIKQGDITDTVIIKLTL